MYGYGRRQAKRARQSTLSQLKSHERDQGEKKSENEYHDDVKDDDVKEDA